MSQPPEGARLRSPSIRRSLILLGVVLALLATGTGFLLRNLQVGVDSTTSYATTRYPGDPTEALMQLVQDEEAPLRQRNRAIWALGRVREAQARPLLAGLHTGGECVHDSALCQHELGKALRRIESRGN